MYGNTAVVVSRYRQEGRFLGKDLSHRMNVTDIWVRRDAQLADRPPARDDRRLSLVTAAHRGSRLTRVQASARRILYRVACGRALRRRGELAAGRRDVAPAGEPHGRRDARLLELALEGVDRLARGAVVGPRRVVGDQVDLERACPRAAGRGRVPCSGLSLTPASITYSTNTRRLRQGEVAPALGDHLGERVALVHRHQLGAQARVGRVQRQGEADRHVDLVDEARQARASSRPSRSSCDGA